jgi:hypothetical protein
MMQTHGRNGKRAQPFENCWARASFRNVAADVMSVERVGAWVFGRLGVWGIWCYPGDG